MSVHTETSRATAGTAGSARRTLPRPAAFLVVAYAFGVTMLGTTLPTPLYPIYQHDFHFGNLLTTVIYAVYAGGVLLALLLFGQASDVLGRRRVLLAGLAVSALSAVLFLTDAGLPVFFTARVLSGLSAGLFTGSATVALVELVRPVARARAALLATAVNMFGLGCGPLLAGLLAEYATAPLRLPYLVHLALLVPAAFGIWLIPETVRLPSGRRLRPQRLAVPAEARQVFLPASIAAFAGFAVLGLLTAVAPGFLSADLGESNRAMAGVVAFAVFAGSAVGQVGLARLAERVALPTGSAVLLVGLGTVGIALASKSLAFLLVGAIVLGIGQGIGFRAGMLAITARSPADRRAETVSSYFVVAYTGISVPVVLIGVAAVIWDLRTAALGFTAVIALVVLGTLIAVSRLVTTVDSADR